jgi:hypothetical protein
LYNMKANSNKTHSSLVQDHHRTACAGSPK